MNSTITLIITALLGAAAVGWAQDGTPSRRTFGNGVLPEYLAIYDVDDSGGLSVEEFQTLQADRLNRNRHQRFRARWDTNHDGRISAAEREAAKMEIRRAIQQRRIRRFNEVDTDGNDFLTEAEFLSIGAVSLTDMNNPGIGSDLFRHLDRNDDDRVSKDEFLLTLNAIRPEPVGTPTPVPKPHERTNSSDGNGP